MKPKKERFIDLSFSELLLNEIGWFFFLNLMIFSLDDENVTYLLFNAISWSDAGNKEESCFKSGIKEDLVKKELEKLFWK